MLNGGCRSIVPLRRHRPDERRERRCPHTVTRGRPRGLPAPSHRHLDETVPSSPRQPAPRPGRAGADKVKRNPYLGQTVDPYHGAEWIDLNRPIPDISRHTIDQPWIQQQQYRDAGSVRAPQQHVNVSAPPQQQVVGPASIPPDRPSGRPPVRHEHHGIDAGDVAIAVGIGVATYAAVSVWPSASPEQRAAARPWKGRALLSLLATHGWPRHRRGHPVRAALLDGYEAEQRRFNHAFNLGLCDPDRGRHRHDRLLSTAFRRLHASLSRGHRARPGHPGHVRSRCLLRRDHSHRHGQQDLLLSRSGITPSSGESGHPANPEVAYLFTSSGCTAAQASPCRPRPTSKRGRPPACTSHRDHAFVPLWVHPTT